MKLKSVIFTAFALLAAALVAVPTTSCIKEKPYSLYQVVTDLDLATEGDASNALADYLIIHGYIRNAYTTFLQVDGADSEANDIVAEQLFNNLVSDLNAANDRGELVAAMAGKPNPPVSFNYYITRGRGSITPWESVTIWL